MSGSVGLPPIPTYLSIIKNEATAATKAEAADPATQVLLKHFSAAAPTLRTPQQLLGDYRSLTVVLGAFGMSGMVGQTAIISKLMTQDPTAKTSLAQTSGNALWQRFAQQMSGWTSTSTPLSKAGSVATIAGQFTENRFEAKEGDAAPGLQQALYFTRTVAADKGSLNALMSDPTQINVVETVLGYDPTQFGALDFDQQQDILKRKLNFSDLSSASSIQRYAERYLAITVVNPPSTAASTSVETLFDTGAPGSLLGIIGASLSVSV